jgi:hypothetical protein
LRAQRPYFGKLVIICSIYFLNRHSIYRTALLHQPSLKVWYRKFPILFYFKIHLIDTEFCSCKPDQSCPKKLEKLKQCDPFSIPPPRSARRAAGKGAGGASAKGAGAKAAAAKGKKKQANTN